VIIINIQNITQEADSLNIKNADPSESYRKNYKPYDSGEISKHITPITYVDYEKNHEVILDKDGKQLPPLSAGSDKVNIELIFKMFEQFPMHQV
jgi:hypothetical protein